MNVGVNLFINQRKDFTLQSNRSSLQPQKPQRHLLLNILMGQTFADRLSVRKTSAGSLHIACSPKQTHSNAAWKPVGGPGW